MSREVLSYKLRKLKIIVFGTFLREQNFKTNHSPLNASLLNGGHLRTQLAPPHPLPLTYCSWRFSLIGTVK